MTTNHAYLEYEGKSVDLPHFPCEMRGFNCWNLVIEDWCKKHGLPYQHVDPFWVTTQVNKSQIENFIMENFGHMNQRDDRGDSWRDHDRHKMLEKLRSFLCSELPEGQRAVMGGFDY
jgi:hypothetical protein